MTVSVLSMTGHDAVLAFIEKVLGRNDRENSQNSQMQYWLLLRDNLGKVIEKIVKIVKCNIGFN